MRAPETGSKARPGAFAQASHSRAEISRTPLSTLTLKPARLLSKIRLPAYTIRAHIGSARFSKKGARRPVYLLLTAFINLGGLFANYRF